MHPSNRWGVELIEENRVTGYARDRLDGIFL